MNVVTGISNSAHNKALGCLKSYISEELIFLKKKKKLGYFSNPRELKKEVTKAKMALDKFCIFVLSESA